MCYFVAYLSEKGLGHATIKSYLAGVRSLQIEYGFQSPFDVGMPKLDRIMKGIKVAQGKAGRAQQKKLPITPRILRQIRSRWPLIGRDYRQTMLWAAAKVCFFGFMRSGELMVDRRNSFDPGQHVSLDDVATDDLQCPTMVQLTLKCSKTDPFQKGVDIVLGATGNELCPVRALFEYLTMRGKANGPLLIHKDGSPMTRSYFVREIRSTLGELGYTNTLLYSGHSFRAGAATTAAAMQVEDSVIKTLGRWESAAYLLYIRMPKEDLKHISGTLSRFGTE